MDLLHQPLPEIPLPNDIATRYDETSSTRRRINASMVAPTRFEARTREKIDQLDGWGIFMPLTIPFTGPLDIASILKAHRDANYDLGNDVVYLINVDSLSPEFGRIHHLDLGSGNYPVVMEKGDAFGKNDPRSSTLSLFFEESDEDSNHDGRLDPSEDTDADGVLDVPNYLPGASPPRADLAARADALMTFYERETNTLILRPLLPLNERTTYAVVVTRRLKDAQGRPVGSPFPYINHTAQNEDLRRLAEVLPSPLSLEDVAFAFSFTTQTTQSAMKAVREGLYDRGAQAHLGQNYPAVIDGLETLRTPDSFPYVKNVHILHAEEITEAFKLLAALFFSAEEGSVFLDMLLESQRYVDFHVLGTFTSPQLFMRQDAQGKPLGLNDQSWPPDLDRVPAAARAETVVFHLVVPRKEVSVRGQGKPAPVTLIAHGYRTNRAEILTFGPLLARHGMASIIIDAPSHGLELNKMEMTMIEGLAKYMGLASFQQAFLKDRTIDQNGDGIRDSGTDYWTAYAFHTRDMVRQTALDYLQLIRILRTFDGSQRWAFDVNGDGRPGLAGDFDGDGQVDVGAPFTLAGGSLGGFTSMVVGSLEPQIRAVAPIATGGGLGDVAVRSINDGVPQAVFLRIMGPLYVGTLKPETGEMVLETIVPDLTQERVLRIGAVQDVRPGDTLVVENLRNRKRGCGVVSQDGRVRAAVPSDLEDETRLLFYAGPVVTGPDCQLRAGAEPKATVDRLGESLTFQGKAYAKDSPLVALAEGLGLRRASPDLRRTAYLVSLVTDASDPVAFLPAMQRHPITYSTGESTGSHMLLIPSVGDMDVPVSTAVTAGRAAGLIGFLDDDPRYGKSVNQVLIDSHLVEGVEALKRFTNSVGQGIHMDVDNLSGGDDMWGSQIPRLSPPLRAGLDQKDPLGGVSGVLFTYSDPTGMHAFDLPGQMTDRARKACKDAGGKDCETLTTFDIGTYMFNLLGRYLRSGGTTLVFDPCYRERRCPGDPPVPAARGQAELP
jgi:hypothetical protein